MAEPVHIVAFTSAGWGHIISLLQLSLSLLGSHDRLHVTILCTAESHTKVLKQLDRHRHLSPEVRRRVQVLCTKEEARPACVPEDWVEPTAVNAPGAAAILEDLILVKGNGAVGDRFRITPRIIIYDLFQSATPLTIRALEEILGVPHIPCLYLTPVPTSIMLRTTGRSEWDSYTGISDRFDRFKAQGMPDEEAFIAAWQNAERKLIVAPGLPPMYDYEYHPQVWAQSWPPGMTKRIEAIGEDYKNADGYITFGVRELEPWDNDVFQEVLGSIPLYPVGAQLGNDVWADDHPAVRTSYSEDERKVIDFLDQMQAERGQRSVAFVSLGSVCWPIRRPELIQYLVESLLAADIPFLFATASRFTQLDQDLRTKVEAGGKGMIVPWVPQNTVLQHPAVRFFLTHCGSGSVVEAITAEMPIVAWPYVGDQTIWARQPGVELHQVKSGMRGKPLGIGGLVEETEAAIKREMAEAWGAMMNDQRYEGFKTEMREIKRIVGASAQCGESRKAMDRILQKYLS